MHVTQDCVTHRYRVPGQGINESGKACLLTDGAHYVVCESEPTYGLNYAKAVVLYNAGKGMKLHAPCFWDPETNAPAVADELYEGHPATAVFGTGKRARRLCDRCHQQHPDNRRLRPRKPLPTPAETRARYSRL